MTTEKVLTEKTTLGPNSIQLQCDLGQAPAPPWASASLSVKCWAEKYTEGPERDDADEKNRPGAMQKRVVGTLETGEAMPGVKGAGTTSLPPRTAGSELASCSGFS